MSQPGERDNNVLRSLDRDIPWIENAQPRPGVLQVAAGGPSLPDAPIDPHQPIICVNYTHEWLIEQRIIPTFCAFHEIDARLDLLGIKPHPDVTYLLSAQCADVMFEYLKGHRVKQWAPDMGRRNNQTVKGRIPNAAFIKGGVPAGMRALRLGYALGWRRFACYGFDSSYGQQSHAYCDIETDGDMDLEWGGQRYRTSPPLVKQAKAFMQFQRDYGVDIMVHGSGLLPDMHRQQFGDH